MTNVIFNDFEAVEFLIEHGANVNLANNDGITPLMRVRSPLMAQLLINNGADLNAVDKNCKTVLMHHDKEDDLELYEMLEVLGAKPLLDIGEGNSGDNDKLVSVNPLATNIIIPDGVTNLCNDALKGCSSLESMTIPKHMRPFDFDEYWPSFDNYIDFSDCTSLKDIYYKGTKNDWLFGSSFPAFVPPKVTVHCSDGIVEPFGESVKVPEGEVEISDATFLDAPVEITLPSTLEQICDWAFKGASISAISIPESVKYIGERAFESSSLKRLFLPKSCPVLEEKAFGYLELDEVTYAGTKEEWEKEYGWNCYEGDNDDSPFYDSTISSGVIKCSDGEIPFKNPE